MDTSAVVILFTLDKKMKIAVGKDSKESVFNADKETDTEAAGAVLK